MRFLEGHEQSAHDLTFNDVFLVPQMSEIASRSDVDLSSYDGTGNFIPITVANMTAVAGKRMTETVARRGGIVALPQDISPERLVDIIQKVKSADPYYETPVTLSPDDSIHDALNLMHKRSHGAVVIVDEDRRPTAIFTESDAEGRDMFAHLGRLALPDMVAMDVGLSPAEAYNFLESNRLHVAPVVDQGKLVGIMTDKSALRAEMYTPNLDEDGRLKVIATIGINGDVEQKTLEALQAGADLIMVDTAHGHQIKTLEALRIARKTAGENVIIIAGNVVTAEGTKDLIEAGANIVKVGVGPGAMCTTRMMTGVGRPQFSAILECATEADKHGATILADGGIKFPRDVALALAAGASNVMIGSLFAGTYESAADIHSDDQGRKYKKNFGMASGRAVQERNDGLADAFAKAKKGFYTEGISDSRMYIQPGMPGAEDVIDHIVAGVRSALTYSGAANLQELREKSLIGVQSSAGYQEGRPVHESW